MNRTLRAAVSAFSALAVALSICHGANAADSRPLRLISERTVSGLEFPESAAYDPRAKVLYVGQFGGTKLDPGGKDGLGRISKVSLDGKILEDRFLPASGEKMNKPKGIWVKGNRLWVTDIDAVWIFDLKTRQGRKLEIAGMVFANDPAVMGSSLYVSDNRTDRLYRIEPPDFLRTTVHPQVSIVLAGRSIFPNGIYPGKRKELLMGGFQSPKDPRGIYSVNKDGELKEIASALGRVDGLYQMKDGSILGTEWNTGSLFSWTEKGGMHKIVEGFKGPADFTVIEDGNGVTVAIADLVASHLRIIRLGR